MDDTMDYGDDAVRNGPDGPANTAETHLPYPVVGPWPWLFSP